MIIFKYPPILVPQNCSHATDVYARMFPDHRQWLLDNDIDYNVNRFCWPELLSNLMHRQLGMIVCEFEVTVEDERQAIMFCLYSGIKAGD